MAGYHCAGQHISMVNFKSFKNNYPRLQQLSSQTYNINNPFTFLFGILVHESTHAGHIRRLLYFVLYHYPFYE